MIDESKLYSLYYHAEGPQASNVECVYPDHNAIKMNLNWKQLVKKENEKKSIMIMTKKNYENYANEIQIKELTKNIDMGKDMQTEYTEFVEEVDEIYRKNQKKVKQTKKWKINRKLLKSIRNLKRKMKVKRLCTKNDSYELKRIKLLKEHCEEEVKNQNRAQMRRTIEVISKSGRTDLSAFWDLSKKERKSGRESRTAITNLEGERIEDEEEVKKVFTDYYQDLLTIKMGLNEEEKVIEDEVKQIIHGLELASQIEGAQEFTYEEIDKVVSKLKKKKARDQEGWRNEHVIFGGEEIKIGLTKLFNMMLKELRTPEQWQNMRIKSIPKDKGNKIDNRRGLFITNVVSKIMERTIKNRNEENWKKEQSPFQCGGVKGRSTADNVFVILAIMQRNQYLKKPTYVVFIDLEKCFDKLWLDDGIAELWKSGMPSREVKLISEMNKSSKVIVETPVGDTECFELGKVVKQGTVYGPVICGKETERINNISEHNATMYGPNLEILTLVYVDDMAHGGDKENGEKLIRNCGELEKKKKATVKLSKSGYVVVKGGKGNQKELELESEVKNGRLERKTETKYLGTWIDETGRYSINLQKLKPKVEMAIKKVEEMASDFRLGNLATEIRIQLYDKVINPTMLYNIQVWPEFTKKELEQLEQKQGQIIKRLLKLPGTTSYRGTLWETGIWPVDKQIVYKKLMFYHNLIGAEEDRIARKVVIEQEKLKMKGSWFCNLEMEAEMYGITINEKKVQIRSKRQFKKEVKEKIQQSIEREERERNAKKMRTVMKTGFGIKKYMKGRYNQEEVADILKIKLHMMKLNGNMGNKEVNCKLCGKETETTEHIMLHCTKLNDERKEIGMQGVTLESNEEEDINKLLQMKNVVEWFM